MDHAIRGTLRPRRVDEAMRRRSATARAAWLDQATERTQRPRDDHPGCPLGWAILGVLGRYLSESRGLSATFDAPSGHAGGHPRRYLVDDTLQPRDRLATGLRRQRAHPRQVIAARRKLERDSGPRPGDPERSGLRPCSPTNWARRSQRSSTHASMAAIASVVTTRVSSWSWPGGMRPSRTSRYHWRSAIRCPRNAAFGSDHAAETAGAGFAHRAVDRLGRVEDQPSGAHIAPQDLAGRDDAP